MKELRVTIAGVEYTAPAPRVAELKGYYRLLREQEQAKAEKSNEDIEAQFAFIASLFQNQAVTVDALNQAELAEGLRLVNEYAGWLSQYIPDTGKNAKAR